MGDKSMLDESIASSHSSANNVERSAVKVALINGIFGLLAVMCGWFGKAFFDSSQKTTPPESSNVAANLDAEKLFEGAWALGQASIYFLPIPESQYKPGTEVIFNPRDGKKQFNTSIELLESSKYFSNEYFDDPKELIHRTLKILQDNDRISHSQVQNIHSLLEGSLKTSKAVFRD